MWGVWAACRMGYPAARPGYQRAVGERGCDQRRAVRRESNSGLDATPVATISCRHLIGGRRLGRSKAGGSSDRNERSAARIDRATERRIPRDPCDVERALPPGDPHCADPLPWGLVASGERAEPGTAECGEPLAPPPSPVR